MNPAQYSFGDAGGIPNNPHFPMLVYSNAIDPLAGDPAIAFETLFSRNGWDKGWRNGIFDYAHYHSNTHEVLGIAVGSAKVRFGGTGGAVLTVTAGNAVLIPAGTGHERISCTSDLLVIGFYPPGPAPDLIGETGSDLEKMRSNINSVGRPSTDPVTGAIGGLLNLWNRSPQVSTSLGNPTNTEF
ncbi:MAG: hypothetical protein KDA52_12390 [Planctomycetaceae bacterium]|nr:hypothetical protein [Planctomycetaceae bacterium]